MEKFVAQHTEKGGEAEQDWQVELYTPHFLGKQG